MRPRLHCPAARTLVCEGSVSIKQAACRQYGALMRHGLPLIERAVPQIGTAAPHRDAERRLDPHQGKRMLRVLDALSMNSRTACSWSREQRPLRRLPLMGIAA
jgi:hypothetical protein